MSTQNQRTVIYIGLLANFSQKQRAGGHDNDYVRMPGRRLVQPAENLERVTS